MKNMKKFGPLFIMILVLIGVTSCNDENTEAFEVKGDAIIIKRMLTGEDTYASALYVYGNYQMSDVSVITPDEQTITLTAADENQRAYLKEPGIADFSTEVPATGLYSFYVTNEDIEHSTTDVLEFNDIGYATITEASYDGGTIMVEWESVDEASNYMVKLVDEDFTTIFTGYLLTSSANIFQIQSSTGTWNSTPTAGGTYFVEVHAFEYDTEATSSDYTYNINEISIATETVVWGE